MITEDYVSFEIAKLLKEKGFNEPCHACYAYFSDDDIRVMDLKYSKASQSLGENRYPDVSLYIAMKWLREVHNLHIGIARGPKGYHITIETIPLGIVKYITRDIVGTTYVDSYEEACEAAIKYCLKLI